MGIQVKKNAKKFLKHGDLLMLPGLLMSFRTATFGDTERIRKLIKLSEQQGDARQVLTLKFFKENNLPEDEAIEPTHPLFAKLNISVLGADSGVSADQLAVFTQKEFNTAVDGKDFNYSERSALQNWLVKK